MNDPSWWATWGQSATAIGGCVLGVGNAYFSIRKHLWEKRDRQEKDARLEWWTQTHEALAKMAPGETVVVPDRWRTAAHEGEALHFFQVVAPDGTGVMRVRLRDKPPTPMSDKPPTPMSEEEWKRTGDALRRVFGSKRGW